MSAATAPIRQRCAPAEAGTRGAPRRPSLRSLASLCASACLLLIACAIVPSCERPGPVEAEKKRTLTADERYIVQLYMKINELEENLQDNPEEREKKWSELREQYDPARIRRILEELERDPERWLAIYERINEQLERRKRQGAT